MNLKQLFTLARNKAAEKRCFIDKDNQEYILTNLTNAKSGVVLYNRDNYNKISDDIREINKIIKNFKVIK